MKLKRLFQILLASSVLLADADVVCAQGTAFSYQGRLNDSGGAANGNYDLTFTLFSVAAGTGQIGSTLTLSNTAVTKGLFQVTLDFTTNFTGADRWLEIAVRTNGANAFTTLLPRQAILPVPYAIKARS